MNREIISLTSDGCRPFSISSKTNTPPSSNTSNKCGNVVNNFTVPNDSSLKNSIWSIPDSISTPWSYWACSVFTPTVVLVCMISLFSKSSESTFCLATSSSSNFTCIFLIVGSAFCNIFTYFLIRSSEKDSISPGFRRGDVMLNMCISFIASTSMLAKSLFNIAAITRHSASSLTILFISSKFLSSDLTIISWNDGDVLSRIFSVLRYFLVKSSWTIFCSNIENS